jgi:xanthine dehydrogenase accessory factor
MRENLSPASIARLVCPIGIAGISSKWPAAIAVGVAAQVLRDISTSALNADSAEHARVGAFAVVPVAAAPVAIAPTAAGSCEHRNCADCGS